MSALRRKAVVRSWLLLRCFLDPEGAPEPIAMKVCFRVNALSPLALGSPLARDQSLQRGSHGGRLETIGWIIGSAQNSGVPVISTWEPIRMNSPNEVCPVWRFGLIGL